MGKLLLALKQRFYEQTLQRKPEMDLVMLDREQDEQFTKDGVDGGLAVLYDLVINTLQKIAPSSGNALDICCGSGQLLCKIAKSKPGIKFTGLDLSSHMLNLSKENKEKYGVTNLDFTKGSMYELRSVFKEKRFDLITWHLALHHCERDQDVVNVINELTSLLTEKGTLFIFDIERPKTGRMAIEFADMYNHQWGEWFYHDSLDSYKAAFTFDELDTLVARSNLKEYRHIHPVIGNVFQMVFKSSTWNADAKEISNLKHGWQKTDYNFLKMIFRLDKQLKGTHG